MYKRLFFLRHDGWFESRLEGKLLHAGMDEIIPWAYAMMERHHYRNYMITENPRPSLRRMQPVYQVATAD
jgi:hypothetical protein